MKLNYRWLFFMTIIIIVSGHACQHEPFEPRIVKIPRLPVDSIPQDTTDTTTNPPIDTGACDPDSVYFEQDVLPIILGNCAIPGCHDAGSAQNGVILTNYAQIISTGDVRPGDFEGSDLYDVITETDLDKRMPYQLPKLSDADIEAIRVWIEQGALNNSCGDTTDTSTAPIPTYTADIEPIITANCAITDCHGGSQPPQLTTYALVQAQAERVKIRTTAETMPPAGQPDLTQDEINKIARWADNGAPE